MASAVLAIPVVRALGPALSQEDSNAEGSKLPRQRVLTGDDARRVAMLEETIGTLQRAAQFVKAVEPAREALAVRRRLQGDDHWQTVDARFAEQTCERAARLTREEQSDLAGTLRKRVEADKLNQAGRYAEAEPLFRDILAVCRRLLGEDHPYTAQAMNNLAGTLNGQARSAEAEPLTRAALAIRRRVLGEDHPHTASSYHTLAFYLNTRGQYSESESLYRTALAILLRTREEDHPHTANVHDLLAYNLNERGNYAGAEPHWRAALAIRRRTLDEDHPHTARGYYNLAAVLQAQGKFAEAEPLLQMALGIHRRNGGEDQLPMARYCVGLAVNQSTQGKTAEAEQLARTALAIHLQSRGKDDRGTATSYFTLAGILDSQGRNKEAEESFRTALEIYRHTLDKDHAETVRCGRVLAENLHLQGRYDEAEPLLRTALAFQRRARGEHHPHTAETYHLLAVNQHAQGRDDKAEELALAAARSYEEARRAVAFTGLGRVEFASRESPSPLLAALLARQGRGDDAWQHWEAGLARGLLDELTVRRARPLTPDERRRQEDLIGGLIHLDNQIGALLAEGNAGEAVERLGELKDARLEVQHRLSRLEADLAKKYGAAAGSVLDLDRIQATLPADAALVGWIDLRSGLRTADPRGDHWACVVRSSGAPRWVRIAGTGPDQAWTAEDDARAARVRGVLNDEALPGWQAPLAGLAEQRLAPLEVAFRAGEGLPEVRHLIVLPSPALAGIPVEALLEARPPDAPRYLVSYSPSGTTLAWLRERRQQDQGHPAKSRRLLALGDPVPPPADRLAATAAEPPDHGLLVQRVDPGSNAEQAGIRPGDVLLRYAGAPLATADELQAQVQAQVHDREPTRVPVSIWRKGATTELVIRPGPLGITPDKRPAAGVILAQREADSLLRQTRGAHFGRLPYSRTEVRAIAGLFDKPEVHLGSDASEQTLEAIRARGDLKNFDVIHLATHGTLDDMSPLNSRLLLSQDKLSDPAAFPALERPTFDGVLTASEVLGTWRLDAELVTLSACQSGLGRRGGGEGFVGLTQAFLLAGGRSLVVSLWKVDDRATSLLMTRFYQNWLGKPERLGVSGPVSKAEALREAKEWLRGLSSEEVRLELKQLAPNRVERGEPIERPGESPPPPPTFAHPHDWAGFILLGDPI